MSRKSWQCRGCPQKSICISQKGTDIFMYLYATQFHFTRYILLHIHTFKYKQSDVKKILCNTSLCFDATFCHRLKTDTVLILISNISFAPLCLSTLTPLRLSLILLSVLQIIKWILNPDRLYLEIEIIGCLVNFYVFSSQKCNNTEE